MCGPAALPLAAAAMTIGGQITQGVGQARQASYEAQVARINSTQASQDARDAIIRGQNAVTIQQQKAGQQRGQMRAALAANGIDPAYGSSLDILADQTQFSAEDSQNTARNSEREAMGYRIQASNYTGQAMAAKSAERGAIIGTVFKVGSTALNAASQVGKINAANKGFG